VDLDPPVHLNGLLQEEVVGGTVLRGHPAVSFHRVEEKEGSYGGPLAGVPSICVPAGFGTALTVNLVGRVGDPRSGISATDDTY
jgi:hypothetical protein